MFSGSRCRLRLTATKACPVSACANLAPSLSCRRFPTYDQSPPAIPHLIRPFSDRQKHLHGPRPLNEPVEKIKWVEGLHEKLESARHVSSASQNVSTASRPPHRIRNVLSTPKHGSRTSIRRTRSQQLRQKAYESALELLCRSVPTVTTVEADELWMTKSALERASGACTENRWVHHVQNGCTVIVTGRASTRSNYMQILLRGASTLARSQTQSFLLSSERYDKATTVRRVQTEPKHALHSPGTVINHELPVDSIQSVPDFLRLIRLWISEDVSQEGSLHVANKICLVLTDPRSNKFASAVALDEAFQFLGRTAQLIDKVMPIYDYYQTYQPILSQRTYSLVLRNLLRAGQVYKLARVLQDMSEEGLVPNQQVWQTLLHQSSPWPQLKHQVITTMSQRGVFQQPCAREHLAAEVAADLIARKPTILFAYFLAFMDTRFGRDWMAEASLAYIWRACLRSKAWTLALDLLKEAQGRAVPFGLKSTSMVMLIMRRCSVRRSIRFLQSHLVGTAGRYDRQVIPILFFTAWKRRFTNVCKAIWIYAATKGLITSEMRQSMLYSLYILPRASGSVAGHAPLSSARFWQARASTLIAGIELKVAMPLPSQLLLEPDGEKSVHLSSDPDSLSVVRSSQPPVQDWGHLARLLIDRDTKAGLRFAAPSSARFFKLLEDAYELDVQWARDGRGPAGDSTIEWMAENAIKVPLLRREVTNPES